MSEFDDLIRFENENTRLDFKLEEYRKEQFHSFLKDVLAMANANTKEDKYIIIGQKPKNETDRGIVGIKGDLTDSATYQQLVFENIEPEISIEYFPCIIENSTLGIFRLTNCKNQPYLMKKDYGTGKGRLLKGDGFIRKGTHQPRLIRADFERMYLERSQENSFNEEVGFSFFCEENEGKLQKLDYSRIERPSQIQRRKIEKIIKQKRNEIEKSNSLGIPGIDLSGIQTSVAYMNAAMHGTGIPYKNRDIPTLERDLEKIEDTYRAQDNYAFFEQNSNKCNIQIINKGSKYIEDSTIVVSIPKNEGLFVLDRVFRDPSNDENSPIVDTSAMYYPEVNRTDKEYSIRNHVGDIKHQLSTEAFSIPLRILVTEQFEESKIHFKCELYAKNIINKIEYEFEVEVFIKNL